MKSCENCIYGYNYYVGGKGTLIKCALSNRLTDYPIIKATMCGNYTKR